MLEWIEQNPLFSGALLISLIISLRIALGLWLLPRHKETSKFRKTIWSLLVMVPFIGPVFYGGFYAVPDRHPYGGESQSDISGIH